MEIPSRLQTEYPLDYLAIAPGFLHVADCGPPVKSPLFQMVLYLLIIIPSADSLSNFGQSLLSTPGIGYSFCQLILNMASPPFRRQAQSFLFSSFVLFLGQGVPPWRCENLRAGKLLR